MSTAVAVTESAVMMTESEARECLEKIKHNALALRDLLIDFEDREGWRALGYDSWRACATAVFGKSTATVYKQLRAARFEREISHGEKLSAPLPIRQADQLARLDTADDRREAYAEAQHQGGGKATEATVTKAVERRVGPKPPRPSLRSSAEAGDFADLPAEHEFPFDADALAAETDLAGGEPASQDPSHTAGTICGLCGDRFTGTSCPCTPVPGGSVLSDVDVSEWVGQILDAIAASCVKHGGEVAMDVPALCPRMPFDGNTQMQLLRALHAEGVISTANPWETPRWTLAATPDQPAAAEARSDAPDVAPAIDDTGVAAPSSDPAPPALSDPGPPLGSDAWVHQQRQRSGADSRTTLSEGVGGKAKGGGRAPTAGSFSSRPLDAGDLSRALLDLPIAQVAEAIAENATAEQKRALKAALGGASQPEPAPTGTVTVATVKALIREHLTSADVKALEWDLPNLRKELGARERALAGSH